MPGIAKAAVIGAGRMGSAIAAHVANAGVPVALLDIVPEGADDRNELAEGAVSAMLKATPAPFMHRSVAELVAPGNLEDDIGLLDDADWICEAVVEDLDVKRDVYRAVDSVRKAGSVVTSNTSTIPLARLIEGMPGRFASDFAITHFFNPPRYMRLLEFMPAPDMRPEASDSIREFCDVRLGKEVVRAKDTPGFIGNRVGIYWSCVAMSEALALGLTVEEADAVVGPPMGIPKTGIFGLMDLTGIDLAPRVNATMLEMLPPDDAFCREFDTEGPLAALLSGMIAEGRIGRRGEGGFYRMARDGEARELQARDLATGAYRPVSKPRLDSVTAAVDGGPRALVEHPDKGGRYAWRVLSRVLAYAASLVPDVADRIADVDRAMTAGYGWKSGPLEMIDRLGCGWFVERLKADGREIPPLLEAAAGRPLYREAGRKVRQLSPTGGYAALDTPPDAWRLADMKRGREPIAGNGSASLWDVGDGVACLEFHTRMNAIDDGVIAMTREAAAVHERGYRALIVGHDGDDFSVGANLGVALFAVNAAMWAPIERALEEGQRAFLALKYAPFPVVGAPAGRALGGGCEILMHCDAVQAHAETYLGLVEAGVGLVPGWGGIKELLARAFARKDRPGGPMPPVVDTFETIGGAKVSRSAREAVDLLYLGPDDGITMNRRRVLADAKARALSLVESYEPPAPSAIGLPGPSGRATLNLVVDGMARRGDATAHDQVIADALAGVVTGGETDATRSLDERRLLELERAAFMALIRRPETWDRIEHMLDTGRPLRN